MVECLFATAVECVKYWRKRWNYKPKIKGVLPLLPFPPSPTTIKNNTQNTKGITGFKSHVT